MSHDQHTPPPAPAFLSVAAKAAIEQPIMRTPMPPREDKGAWTALIEQTDAVIAEMIPSLSLPFETTLRTIAEVPVYQIVPPSADPTGAVYLDIHGGALIYGGGDLARMMGEIGSLSSGLVHWAVDYRMAPQHPFPAALDDLIAVYSALLKERDASQIIVGGGSAGGNLAAALMLRAKSEGLPMPAGLVLHTPEVDLTESGDSFTTLKDVSVGLQSLREVNELYADGHDLADPLLSPLFGDLAGLPSTLLTTGTRDLFLSNTVRMHRALREAGVDADLHVFDARPHAGFGNAPEEAAVSAVTREFVTRRLRL